MMDAGGAKCAVRTQRTSAKRCFDERRVSHRERITQEVQSARQVREAQEEQSRRPPPGATLGAADAAGPRGSPQSGWQRSSVFHA